MVIVMPVRFGISGVIEILVQSGREEIRSILQKASTELCEFLFAMKSNVDPYLREVPSPNFPEINIISEVESLLGSKHPETTPEDDSVLSMDETSLDEPEVLESQTTV